MDNGFSVIIFLILPFLINELKILNLDSVFDATHSRSALSFSNFLKFPVTVIFFSNFSLEIFFNFFSQIAIVLIFISFKA